MDHAPPGALLLHSSSSHSNSSLEDLESSADITEAFLAERGDSIKRTILGLVCVSIFVCIWILEAEVVQDDHISGIALEATYLIRTAFLAAWIPLLFLKYSKDRFRIESLQGIRFIPNLFSKASFWIFFWVNLSGFFCEFFWYNSLQRTSVSLNTAIYNSMPFFVLCISVVFLKEKFTFLNVLSVFCGICGILVIAFFNKSKTERSSSTLGVGLVIMSVIAYAINNVYLKYQQSGLEKCMLDLPVQTRGPILQAVIALQLVATMGLYTFILFLPVCLVIHFTKVENFTMDSTKVLKYFGIGLLGTAYNLVYMLGNLFTSPLFMSVGTLLTIPASILVDYLLKGYTLPPLSFIGISLIIVSFVVLNFPATRRK